MLKHLCFYLYFICIISPLETSPDLRRLAADVVLAGRIRHRFWSHASQSADVVLNLMAGSTPPCRCFVCFPRWPPRSSSADISFLLLRILEMDIHILVRMAMLRKSLNIFRKHFLSSRHQISFVNHLLYLLFLVAIFFALISEYSFPNKPDLNA